MCGIAGWLDWNQDLSEKQEIVEQMTEMLTPRGPDSKGYWTSDRISLGHRRLVVVDPEGGAQPMWRQYGDKKYILIYNGELYNTEDIRKELKSLGHSFRSHSDTEVLLISYVEWGPECVHKLNGIFAFAVWNEADQSLFIARDRLGVKPLFYFHKDNTFIFGSELKALLAHPQVQPIIELEGLAEIFLLAPARTPGLGIFKDIKELKPGHSMLVHDSGARISPYWILHSRQHEDDLPTTIRRVRELFEDAVRRQLVADVPLCTLLSGGLDSTAITAYAAKSLEEKQGAPLHTFSVDYVDNEEYFQSHDFQPNSDAPWVKLVSNYYKTQHHYVFFDTKDLVPALYPALKARDLPGMADIDSSLLLFCKEIKKHSTVALSGECADEVFGGYPWFHREDALNSTTFPWATRSKEKATLLSAEIRNHLPIEEYLQNRYEEAIAEVPSLPGESPEDRRIREISYLTISRFMPTLLDRKDRMSMAVGLEVRVPFCDHRLVEYLWNVPWSMKNIGGMEKGLLREALKDVLPREVINRKKSPYPKTHNPSYYNDIKRIFLEILDDKHSPLVHLVDIKTLKALANDPSTTGIPWFGQLMANPQLLAQFIQLDYWLREYNVKIHF